MAFVPLVVAREDPTLEARIVSARPLEGVRAGSALVRAGSRLLIVQDDAFEACLLDAATGSLERVALRATGQKVNLPSAGPLPKAIKPDFEAAFAHPDGRIIVLGSGSAPTRVWIASLDWSNGAVECLDGSDLYATIARALGETPNIEGVAVIGERVGGAMLRLFHRGAGGAPSASVDVPLEGFDRATTATGVRHYDLGRASGIALSITDVARDDSAGNGRLIYLAAAEDTPNAIDDGPVVGCALGVLDENGSSKDARFTLIREADGSICTRKLEGLAIGGGVALAVSDPDDENRAADLCTIVLSGF